MEIPNEYEKTEVFISLVVVTNTDWYLQWILPFFRSNQPTNWDDHKQRHHSLSHFIEISNHPSPPQRCHNPPSHRCQVITSSWCILTDDGLSVGVCCQQSNGKRLGGKGEKEPSQKEISSSNDDFSGSMLIFWEEYIHLGLIFVEGHWVFSFFYNDILPYGNPVWVGLLKNPYGRRKRSRFHQFQCCWVAGVDDSEI